MKKRRKRALAAPPTTKGRMVPPGTPGRDMRPGDFAWGCPGADEPKRNWLRFVCPKGKRHADEGVCMVPIAPQKDGAGHSWEWDGKNAEAPTLKPSIRCHGCGWHGLMRNGELVSA